MQTVIFVGNTADPRARYIGWSPVGCAVQLTNPTPVAGPVAVTLRNRNPASGGQLMFRAAGAGAFQDHLTLALAVTGGAIPFQIAGVFGRASVEDGDAAIAATADATGSLLSVTPLMVRVRKDANALTVSERSRFVSALAVLNGAGTGGFTRFRDMHREASREEAHGLAGFLPWHRAYLLDFERALQAIDPRVTLPYWRFDRPAPNLFSRDFLGVSNSAGVVQFSSVNPLQFWATDSQTGINRRPAFDTAMGTPNILVEAATLRLGGPANQYVGFDDLEANPHGRAHTSFGGYIGSIDTAARDPLFFLLHANVDRLWGKWQWFFGRFNTRSTDTFPFLGAAGNAGSLRIGHNLFDTMWPWNRTTVPPRPATAPGGNFPAAFAVTAPGTTPRVGDVIDYYGVNSPANRLGFDYDDVPFEF
jgi:tyrosinase